MAIVVPAATRTAAVSASVRYVAVHVIALLSSGSAHATLRNTSPLVNYFTWRFLTTITVACGKPAA